MEQALTEVIGNQGKSEALGRGRHNASLRVAGDNYTKTKHLIIACAACIILTYLSTSYVIIKHGSTIWSEESVVSLRMKNEASTKKRNELKESLLVMKAVFFDDVDALVESEARNLLRRGDTYGKPHRFTFNRWNRVLQSKILERSIQIGSTNILTYITQQENWSKNISDELASDVCEAIKPNLDKAAFAEMIDSLPDEARATWEHFAAQLKKDEEATIRHIELEYQKETKGEEEHVSID